jgi:tetratricopeptide (TPR) repeat protein
MRRYFNLFVVLMLATPSGAQVRVWEGTLALLTYEEGKPDPNPPFDQVANNRFNYPYVLRDNLTSRRVNHDWRAIYLENEYLKCSVLPDIGGHLYTCVDKISGQSMFYANPSIKKAAVGYRGAWAAFGIEFNFPVSHNWVSMSPVDFAFHQNADGSASVIVGNVDRVYGMEWAVELILRPKSTLLEERVTLSNRSDVRHRFYWWNNAGARVSDDSQIIYPMRFAASHGFTDVVRWPVDEDGHDLSVIRNHVHGAVSLFSHGSREGFMGVWHPATRTGTVHFAEYEDLPAKKIWSWGVDAEGMDWRKALSDDDSGYIEIQAGLFRNQETYAFLEPRQSIHFSEYWMPVREIGPIARANLSGVLSLARHGKALNAGFNANRSFPEARVSILNGGSLLFSEKVDLVPDRAWKHELPILDSHTKYAVEIRDARGAVLIRQTEGEYDWTPESEIQVGPQHAYGMPDPEQRTYDDWIYLGKELELNGKNLQALDTYAETLRRFPASFAAMKSAGRLTASLLRFDEAKGFLEPVHARDTSDPEISYYLGIAYDGLGETPKARLSYEDAQRFAAYRSAAALRLGEMLARDGDLEQAERHLSEAVRSAPDEARAIEELVAVKVASGKMEEGKTLARQAIALFPLSYLLPEELAEPNLQQLANDSIRVLNLAAQYLRLGLYQRALTVLSRVYPSPPPDQTELGALSPGNHPMIAYFRGYCRERLGQSGASDYQVASKLSTSYVFPSSAEELTILRNVVRTNPQDATAQYLLGTLHFSRGLTDSALEEWSLARKLNPQMPVLDASLGVALLHEKHDAEHALSAFRDGLRSDATNVTVYLGADQALSLLSKPASERAQVLEKYPNLGDAPSSLIFELILNLAEAGDFQRAESLFRNRFFPREEGGTNVRQVWVEVELQKMLALAKIGHCADALVVAEQLGAAVPDLPFTRDGLESIVQSARTNYQLGVAYASCALSEEATKKFQLASVTSAPDQMLWAGRAAQKLPDFDGKRWQERLQTALTQAKSRSDTSSYTSWWDYTAGTLAAALGRQQEADERFQKALLLPDRMLAYHFTRMARAEAGPVIP